MKAMTKLIPIICLFVITGGSLFYSCSQEKRRMFSKKKCYYELMQNFNL